MARSSKQWTRYKIRVSVNMYEEIVQTAEVLNVSQQNLIMFLVLNKYDSLYEFILDGDYERIKKDLHVSYESDKYGRDNRRYLQFYVNNTVDTILFNLAERLKITKQKLVALLLYKNGLLFEDIKKKYKMANKIIEEQIHEELDVLGLLHTDFTRIATAYTLYQAFINLDAPIKRYVECGLGLDE